MKTKHRKIEKKRKKFDYLDKSNKIICLYLHTNKNIPSGYSFFNQVQFTAGITLNEKAHEENIALRNVSIPRNGRNG